MNIILIIIPTIVLILLNLLLIIMIIIWERRLRIRNLKTNLGFFPLIRLSNRMESYANLVKINSKISTISEKVNELKLEYRKIEKLIENIEKLMMPINFYKFIQFYLEYRNIIKRVREYEKNYLDIRFNLFDLTCDVEIENAIITQLKERSQKIKESINNSPQENIRNSKKLDNKISNILTSIKKLELLANEQMKRLSEEFINFVKKIDGQINSIVSDINFMNFYIKHIDEELQPPLNRIVAQYKNNKKMLDEIIHIIKKKVHEIKLIKSTIKDDILNLKQKKVKEDSKKLDNLISDLNLLINSNISFSIFNDKYNYISDFLLKHIRENHGLFVSEIKRHKMENENKRLLIISGALQNFETSITKYEKSKINNFNKPSPQKIANLLLNIIHEYNEYINIVKENVSDISKVNNLTNKINSKIALMNTTLLQIEYNINNLHGVLKKNYERKKDELQNKMIILRNNFKDNIDVVDKESFVLVNNLNQKMQDLSSETRAADFEIFFIKESIIFLNKYKGNNNRFDQLLNSIYKSYNNENYIECLRKIKEIIEIYEIK